MKITAPRGTFDILPEDALRWHWLEATIRRIFGYYGYQEIRTPVFEHTELFQRGIGTATDIVEKEMYTFNDKGGRSLTLRPEGTAPVVRSYVEHKLYSRGGITKLFYMGPMFRQERPQAGRFRQFHQFGVELLGTESPLADAEVIPVAVELYKELGLTDLEVLLNSIGCPACREEYQKELFSRLSSLRELCVSCQQRLQKNPMRLLDCKNPRCRELTEDVPQVTDYLCPACSEHLEKTLSFLDRAGIGYRLEPRLVRGFDYYTRTVFEVINSGLGAQNAVCGGGRYDHLVEECGGPPMPGVGFASGMERLLLTLEQQGKFAGFSSAPQVVLVVLDEKLAADGFELATGFRREGITTESCLEVKSLKAQLRAADKLQAKFVVILGEDEWKDGQVSVRRMADGKQWRVDREEVSRFIKDLSGREP
ncbi:MAG: histidine--tRNA ligase [Firmicutes bacterium]|nr:histidine--tRNA ligase [Bacillota bacterium]